MKHTKGPWFVRDGIDVYASGEYICTTSGNAKANARFIVTACNSHDDLLEACKTAYEIFMSPHASGSFTCNCGTCGTCETKKIVEQAITKAEGRE